MKNLRRVLLAIATTFLFVIGGVATATSASANAYVCNSGYVFGVGGTYCFTINGTAATVNYWEVSADTIPNYVGCYVHAQVWQSANSKITWNTSRVSCSSFVSSGSRFIIPVNKSLVSGYYCGRLWFDVNGTNYTGSPYSCAKVG